MEVILGVNFLCEKHEVELDLKQQDTGVMRCSKIFIETLYGYKRSWRNVIFWIFAFLGMVGITLYVFTPLSGLGYVNGIDELFSKSAMAWTFQALPSSIPFRCIYLFNILQLFFTFALVINDMRVFRLDAMTALSVHAQGNSEIVIGNFLGKFLAFSVVNILFLVFCFLLNVLFYSKAFNVGYYPFYWLTLNLPTLIFCFGLSTLLTKLVKNQGMSVILSVAILGILTIPGAIWFNGVLDPLATSIPNMFSDFTGHVNLENYLLQRGFILFFGIGLAVLSVIPYPRIHNRTRALGRFVCVALIPLLLAVGFAVIYICGFQATSKKRETFHAVYAKYAGEKALKIIDNHLSLKETEKNTISVTSRMTVANKDSVMIPLIFYLNPGLVVSSVSVNEENITFRRDHQVLLADVKLSPGEVREIVMNYEGKIDNSFCFLDIPEENYGALEVNTIGIYRFGCTPAFCERDYKLLTPESGWYPVSVPSYDALGFRKAMFTRYRLEVEHDPSLMAICQGSHVDRNIAGKTMFTFDHDMAGISLCVGNYKRREITIDSIRMELFYLPDHEFMLDLYDCIPEKELRKVLWDAKFTLGFYGKDQDYMVNRIMGQIAFDPTLQYPYRWFTLVEVPCDFHVFTGKTLQTGERVQGGMVFVPEKKYSRDVPSASSDNNEEVRRCLGMELAFLTEGSCDLNPTFVGNTNFVSSTGCPIINDILILAFNPLLAAVTEVEDEYVVVDYLKDHSLEEALRDPLLSSELLDKIIRKKCEELNAILMIRIGKEEFREAYHDFLVRHLFEETTFEELSREFVARFNVGLDTIVKAWFLNDRLPAFEIDGRTMGAEQDIIYDFKVFNRSEVPGIITLNNGNQGWIIFPGEGRAIRKRMRYTNNSAINTILALNLPTNINLPHEQKEVDDADTITWFLPLAPTSFLTRNDNEIIVDNEDPGFSILETRKFNFASFFGIVETQARLYSFAPADHWGFTISRTCHGFPVKGAYFKGGGKGNQKVQWETRLLRDGKYEVFAYLPFNDMSVYSLRDFSRKYYYTVFDGKEEHEVILSLDKDDWNWVSLGIFNFDGTARVILSDRDREHDSSGDYIPQDVVADAMKWVKIRE